MTGELLSRVDKREWTRQATDLAYCFAGPLGISRDQYEDSLPHFTPEPETYREKFDTLILVQTPIPEKGLTESRIFEIIGLPTSHPYYEDWRGARFRTPCAPYATWLDDGSRELDLHPTYYPSRYAPADTRLGAALDGAFLDFANKRLGIIPSHYPYLPGSGEDDEHAAYMVRWSKEQWALTAGWFGDPGYGVVTAGRHVVIGKDQRAI